eukprot:4115187-Prymnesium_polylepis.1
MRGGVKMMMMTIECGYLLPVGAIDCRVKHSAIASRAARDTRAYFDPPFCVCAEPRRGESTLLLHFFVVVKRCSVLGVLGVL